jgi:hypothetical protein
MPASKGDEYGTFKVDNVKGARRQNGITEMLLEWSNTVMDSSELSLWCEYGHRIVQYLDGGRREIEWMPTWVPHQFLGPELLDELPVWEELLRKRTKRSKSTIEEELIFAKTAKENIST